MSRIRTPAVEAPADLFAQIKKIAGKMPNTFAAIGGHGPAALKAILRADAVLAAGSLSQQDQETIKLAVSAAVGCDYCEAAHSLLAKLAGLEPDVLKQIRAGQPTGDAKRDALVRFVCLLVLTRGTVSDEEFSAIKVAGYTDEQLVDVSLALAVITFTNVFNRTNDTLDRGRLGRLPPARPRLARGRTGRSLNEGTEARIRSSKSWRGPVSSESTSTMISCAPRW